MKGSNRFEIVKKYNSCALHMGEQPTLINNIQQYIKENSDLDLIKSHWDCNEQDCKYVVDQFMIKSYEYDITVEIIEFNTVHIRMHYFGDVECSLTVEIQPSFIKEYLDNKIDNIAIRMQKSNDRKREEERIKTEREEIRIKLFKGEL